MLDVKKLEKLLRDIFTRDNENFSPELVAEELKNREGDFVELDHKTPPREEWHRLALAHLISKNSMWPFDREYVFLVPRNGSWFQVLCVGLGPKGATAATITKRDFYSHLKDSKGNMTPQPHKCTKCGHEEEISPHEKSQNLVVGDKTYCHKCLSEFLSDKVGAMKCTIDFTGDGSEYDKAEHIPPQFQYHRHYLFGRETFCNIGNKK